MTNRLAQETSPYLQQHAANPVDWHPWGPEALARAQREDRPILLSVGYSACHWCHVMARESFEDDAVAAVMNRHFVNIKVDREERPDIDQIYQLAHQMLSRGAGGWPLTMFLAPDGTPFFGGTYFPKTARYGLPGFVELLERVAAVWRERRGEIGEQGEQVREALARTLPGGSVHAAELSRSVVDAQLAQLRATFDAQWMIPHFEKMLYDNGPLLALLADAWRVTRQPLYARCAAETAGWMLREMQSPEGGFYSSLDADSEHEEGKFYVWTREEVQSLLSREEWEAVQGHFGLDREANFEGHHWHLRVAQPLAAGAESLGDRAKAKLFAARERRVRPGRDEKILVSWNALAVHGLARAGRALQRPEWVAAARRAVDFLRATLWRDGRLLATYKDGRAHLAAYLDDYAFLIHALLELLQCRFDASDLEFAEALAEVLLEQFEDRAAGGFFFTAADHERLVHRPKPGHDSAMPSGNGIAALCLNRLAALTGDDRYARAAERAVGLYYRQMQAYPGGFGTLAQALEEAIVQPSVLVLRGRGGSLDAWGEALAQQYLPGTLVVGIENGLTGLPPVLDKPSRPEPVTGWLCRGLSCLEPSADLQALLAVCRDAREPGRAGDSRA